MPIRKRINNFIERIDKHLNARLYDSRKPVLRGVRILSLLGAITLFLSLLYIFGFEPDLGTIRKALKGINGVFIIFSFSFALRWLYSFDRTDFVKKNKVEGLFVFLLIINSISYYFFDGALLKSLYGLTEPGSYIRFYVRFVGIFALFFMLIEFAGISVALNTSKIKPSVAFVLSFVVLITVGTAILMLPAMTADKESMPLIDALFTAVSASCVTGLIVVDTATFFTLKGQIVILLLIQLGGMGIVTFATFFSTFLQQKISIRSKNMIPDYLDTESLATAASLLRQTIFVTLLIEAGTFVLLFFTWGATPFESTSEKVFVSIFHAVSAFCNAGFSVFTNNLYEAPVRGAYILHLVVACSLILGGIGFPAIQDIFTPSRMRERLQQPWKGWEISTRIAVNTSIALLIIGTIGFFFLERTYTLNALNFTEAMITSFFQSATTRTAGFNTVDIGQVSQATLVLMMFLMFIGGCSASTAGGIKTSTFYIIIVSVITASRGGNHLEIGERNIPGEIVLKSLSIFFYAVAINLIGVFVLTLTEPDTNMLRLIFEQVSAFGTVGLSTGITAALSTGGKIMIIISMFLGRVGILTFAVALSTRLSNTNYKYPDATVMVG